MAVLDVSKPFDRSLSIFYLLPILYVAWTMRGWAELTLYGVVVLTVFLAPLLTAQHLLTGGYGIFNRSLGVILGMLIVFLMWEWRRAAALLQGTNTELEERVAARTVALQETACSLRQEIAERQRAEANRKQLEQRLAQAGKMEAIGRLAGGIAHDFNNLLTIITGYTDMVMRGPSFEEAAQEPLRHVKTAAERAAWLTHQLLAFSRRQVLEARALDLNAIVTEINNMLRRMIGEDIELATRLAPDLSPVEADPGQITQVIMNLAVNARDAMPQGGKLTIETRNQQLDESFARTHPEIQPGPHVLLQVSDTGCGMDKDVLAHLFEPFFTTKEVGKGTGLGLATVYGIVRQLGGCIDVDSLPGQGTTFSLYFRAGCAVVRPSKSQQGLVRPPKGTETVLLLEDDDGVRELTRRILASEGYRVLDARTAEEALQLSQEQGPIHLLLTDVVMPRVSGPKMAELLSSACPNLRVLYMSGYPGDFLSARNGIEEGIPFLEKPFSPASLVSKVRDVLDQA